MIHTYKRRRTSLKSCSFYERLWGDPSTECSPITTPIENNVSNGCCSGDGKEAKRNGWAKDDLYNNSNFLQSLPRESFEAQPIKFKYVRRSKSLCTNARNLHYMERMTEKNAVQPDLDKIDCIAFQSKLPLVDQNQDILGQDTGLWSGDSFSKKEFANRDKCLRPLENSGCCGSYSHNHCINIDTNEAKQLNSVSPDIDRRTGGSFYDKISNKEENEMGRDCSNISAKGGSESDCTSTSIMLKSDSIGRDGKDGSSCQNCHKRVQTKWGASLLTYNRRPRKGEYSSKTYVDLLAERTNYVIRDQILFESAGSHKHYTVPKIIDRGTSVKVLEQNASFSPPLEKLTDGISATGAMISGQGNQKERNGCQLMDDVKVGKVTTLNNEVETGHQSDDAIKSPCAICDLSIHTANEASSTGATMENAFKAAHGNSQNQERAAVASKHCSDKPDTMDFKLAGSTECEGVVLNLQSKAIPQFVGRNIDASLLSEARRANREDLLETMKGRVTGTKGLPNLNAEPPNDCGFISQNRKMLYSIALPNDSTNSKVLQLFPEGNTGHALGTPNPGFVPAVTSNNSSVTMALPASSIGPREFIQNKMFEPSSSQERHKLLLDGIGSSNRPQLRTIEVPHQDFQAFTSYWSEEELDNLWVGVRRHGKDNWYILLRDPTLRFSPWRTERDLAEKWIMEQSKLLGNNPSPQCQYPTPIGIPMLPPFVPPRPGSMTRFLTDPTQLSPSYAYLNHQGMLPPRPPQNVDNAPAPGNGTRLLNRRVRANRRSQNSQNSWGKFKARNDVISPLQFPTPRPSTSRNGIPPSCISTTFDHPQPRPPLPIPPLSLPHSSNSNQFHGKLKNKALNISTRNGIHSSNSGLICPGLANHSAQPSQANPRDLERPKVLINLDNDASSEGTLSDDDKKF